MQKISKGQEDQRKKPRTRDRILQAARELFNKQGEARVTLAHIGEYMGISEGNVWYHFHTKQDVIYALFMELQVQIRANQQLDLGGGAEIEQLQNLVARAFHLMWEYRFLFRDHINWAAGQPEIYEQIVALTNQGCVFVEHVLEQMRQRNLIELKPQEAPILATNIWIVCRYWIDYCQARSDRQQITEQRVQEGIQQVRALILPYMTPLGHRQFNIQS
ncbi:TetR family transcriptional regulator [Dictyobacter sp. S3.2.2.5]|uniref:TetR family transcriptional regulator n=1 Tax=Dictyobacter halimunensis TaxID=3026934 RepID=A0ABQ6FMT9_9CHLR|nr:TetR family transcriptional regulator [Dictyobacter sp. S3.2.2.5]